MQEFFLFCALIATADVVVVLFDADDLLAADDTWVLAVVGFTASGAIVWTCLFEQPKIMPRTSAAMKPKSCVFLQTRGIRFSV